MPKGIRGFLKGEGNPNFGKHLSEEVKRKLSESKKGRRKPLRTQEHRQNLRRALLGHILSDKTKKKISQSRKNQCMGNENPSKRLEVRRKISQALAGRPQPKELIEKMKATKKRKFISGELNSWNKGKECPQLSKENNGNWHGGKSFELYGFEWTDLFKHSIRTRDYFICRMCRKHGWVVHHIDYDKKNNNPENLITLCNKCHCKTNFNREKWIEYFKNYE